MKLMCLSATIRFTSSCVLHLFTLKNRNGLVAQVTNYGGRIISLWTPDKDGNFDDIVIGYNTLDGYLNSNEIYYGALIGW